MNNLIAEQIKEDSPHLAQVKNLGRKNSRTLGFFPEGAFEEHAAKGSLIIVRNKKGEVYGYLLFRVVHRGGVLPVAVIVHLCVDGAYRNKGIAKILVKKLRDITEDNFLRLELSCRRDYEANKFWPRIGFKYTDETLGRGGQPIVKWVMEFRKLPLMLKNDG